MAMTLGGGEPGRFPADRPLEWGTRPWRDDPARAALGLLGTLALAALAFALLWDVSGGPVISLALGCAGGAVLAPVVFPSAFRVDERGVAARRFGRWRLLPWSRIRRARVRSLAGGGAALVSPDEQPRPWAAWRALVVTVPDRHPERDRILAELRQRFAAHGL